MRWAAIFALGGPPLACCVAFSLALNFKQMCLYLAPAFFCYLLAGCLRAHSTNAARLLSVARLGASVLTTFAVCWLPFVGSMGDVAAVARRVFPVERHLYEDKVANLWCTLALLHPLKLKTSLPIPMLVRLAICTTLVGVLPPCALLLARPSRSRFLLCALACALAFFLCSYQVHEKHILLPLLPAALLAHRQPALFGWLAAAATFSLYPLLKRDGLALPYAVTQIAFLAVTRSPLCPRADTESAAEDSKSAASCAALPVPRLTFWAMGLSLGGMLALHATEATVPPPAHYPDLHSVAFAVYACAHFALAYLVTVGAMWVGVRQADGRHSHTPMDAMPVGEAERQWRFVFDGLEIARGTGRAKPKQDWTVGPRAESAYRY